VKVLPDHRKVMRPSFVASALSFAQVPKNIIWRQFTFVHKKLARRLDRCRIIAVVSAVDRPLHITIQDKAEPSRLWRNLLRLSWRQP
jgi:hypothetical protein